jgi:hypothetical protein
MVKDTLDQFERDALMATDLEKEELAFAFDVSTRSIESLARSHRFAGHRAKRKNLYRLAEALRTFRAYELRARRQDTGLNGMEREILRIAEIQDSFVDGRLFFSKRRLARKCCVSVRTVEVWTRQAFVPVCKIFGRKNTYPALASMICLVRNRRLTPQFLCLTLWIGEL